jgi:polyphenol oxidase
MIIHSLSRKFANLLAFTTTREDFSELHPRFTGEAGRLHREKLAGLLDIPVSSLIFPRQCHTANIEVIGTPANEEIPHTDALITSQPGVCLCIQTADCVPLLFYDPEKKVAGAVHAGWRGTLAGLSGMTVARMQSVYGCDPGTVHAVIGPSIGPAVYETGHEVARLFMEKYPDRADFLKMGTNGKYHLDLWKANASQLLDAGLQTAHIDIMEQCTFESAGLYFSARREGVTTGRLVSGIIMSS